MNTTRPLTATFRLRASNTYYYDQLGSKYSDQPDEPTLWEIPRFVDEVEQVRQALGLHQDNFFLFGQSWGAMLAIEYALRYQQHLKGLLISNMMASIPAYNAYVQEVLMPGIDPAALSEIKALESAGRYSEPRFMELLVTHYYTRHVLRMPVEQWPDPVNRAFQHLNQSIYIPMQGPSELGAGGKIANWNRMDDLEKITVPTLAIGARHDTMDPDQIKAMADRLPQGSFLFCPNGSHMAIYDDQQIFMEGIIRFLHEHANGE